MKYFSRVVKIKHTQLRTNRLALSAQNVQTIFQPQTAGERERERERERDVVHPDRQNFLRYHLRTGEQTLRRDEKEERERDAE